MQLRTLDYTVLIVEELERSLEFYCRVLGLRLGHRTTHYAQLVVGTTRLSLYTREAMGRTLGRTLRAPDEDAPGFEIAFLVEDVDAEIDALRELGVRIETPAEDRFWGQRTAYLRDPDGHLVELAQNLS